MRSSGSRQSMTSNDGTPRARRRPRGSRTRLAGLAWALLFLLALPGAAWSETLYDLGAWAEVEADSEASNVKTEVYWGFVDESPVVEQYLYLTDSAGEFLDLSAGSGDPMDTNPTIDDRHDTLAVTHGTYLETPYGMQITLSLRGAPIDISDLVETIFVWNETETPIYLNQDVEVSLLGDLEGDLSAYACPYQPGKECRVRVVDGVAVFEETVVPGANFFDLGDNSFRMQWEIGPGDYLLVSKDKSMNIVPEPDTAALAGLGLLGLAILGRRRRPQQG